MTYEQYNQLQEQINCDVQYQQQQNKLLNEKFPIINYDNEYNLKLTYCHSCEKTVLLI